MFYQSNYYQKHSIATWGHSGLVSVSRYEGGRQELNIWICTTFVAFVIPLTPFDIQIAKITTKAVQNSDCRECSSVYNRPVWKSNSISENREGKKADIFHLMWTSFHCLGLPLGTNNSTQFSSWLLLTSSDVLNPTSFESGLTDMNVSFSSR